VVRGCASSERADASEPRLCASGRASWFHGAWLATGDDLEYTLAVVPTSREPLTWERRSTMPLYEYYCPNCKQEVSITQTISEHAQGGTCPKCKSRNLEPRLGTFFSKTSRKS
jgi:putative FmdB family regulatory protein